MVWTYSRTGGLMMYAVCQVDNVTVAIPSKPFYEYANFLQHLGERYQEHYCFVPADDEKHALFIWKLAKNKLLSTGPKCPKAHNQEIYDKQRSYWIDLVEHNRGIITDVAKAANMNRKTVYIKLKKYDINYKEYRC